MKKFKMRKTRKGPSSKGQLKISLRKRNYFSAFSGWMGNLGVVPLLLFSAFLLLPILVFLAFLLFLVTLVLETIAQLLFASINSIFKFFNRAGKRFLALSSHWPCLKTSLKKLPHFINLEFLPSQKTSVKALILLFSLFYKGAYVKGEDLSKNQGLKTTYITMAKGEILEKTLPPINKYTLGNKEIISAKVLSGGKRILIKARHLGFTDLLIWNQNQKSPQRFQISVVDKRSHREIREAATHLESQGLSYSLRGKTLYARGVLENEDQYKTLVQLRRELKDQLNLSEVSMEHSLKKLKFAQLLGLLQEHNLLSLECKAGALYFQCQSSKDLRVSLKELFDHFLIKWTSQKAMELTRQFEVTLTLQQFENSAGQAFDLGLSGIEADLYQVLTENPLSLISGNSLVLKGSDFRSETLARPKLTGRFLHPIKVRIGQEIPFLQSVTNGVATQQWKFAGLALDAHLKPFTDKILIEFTTNLSQPGEGRISRNSQKSSLVLDLNTPTLLFDIGFRLKRNGLKSLPYLSAIPLFGSLFKGREHTDSYKKIVCFIEIKELPL